MGKAKVDEKLYVDNRKNGVSGSPSADDPMVECDFSEVSRRWGQEWHTLDSQMQQWTAVIFAEPKDDLTDEQSEAIRLGKLDAHQKLEELIVRRNELAAMVVVDVPREWLVKDAPAEIDWGNPDNLLDYVKEVHNTDLLTGITFARIANSKN